MAVSWNGHQLTIRFARYIQPRSQQWTKKRMTAST